MSGHHKRRRGGRGGDYKHGDKKDADNDGKPIDPSSPITQAFMVFHEELDTRHDKHERLVKLSRDITIESKRTIFLLHRATGETSNTSLDQADEKLKALQKTKFCDIAKELDNEDPFQFLRAYSPGLQEYIEAVSFYYYLKEDRLVSFKEIQDELIYPRSASDSQDANESAMDVDKGTPEKSSSTNDSMDKDTATDTQVSTKQITEEMQKNLNCNDSISVYVPYDEYMLGICDLTGELMRLAINSAGAGQTDLSFQVCSFFRRISDAFTALGGLSREVCRKMSTLRRCLQKVEDACYTLQVRGSEIPKHMLADILSSTTSDFVSFTDEVIDDD